MTSDPLSRVHLLCFRFAFGLGPVRQYHDGFAEQVAKWPTNPLDVFIKELQGRAPGAVIGDFGCGMAALAAALPQHRVHSFDLVAANEHVTACDIAHVRLRAPRRLSPTAR